MLFQTILPRKGVPGASAGFTLLELAIVMVILVIVSGGAIGLFVMSSASRKLKRAGAEIEVLAKRAHTAAVTRQTPYALVFTPRHVELRTLAATSGNNQAAPGGQPDDQPAKVASGSFDLDGDMTLKFRHWSDKDWREIGDKDAYVWRFDPDGLCEPISVRVEYGSDWLEESFHPLTGGVKSVNMEAK
jgi:prepilin-type N-terminal cleavage/methylation domain-containing protein